MPDYLFYTTKKFVFAVLVIGCLAAAMQVCMASPLQSQASPSPSPAPSESPTPIASPTPSESPTPSPSPSPDVIAVIDSLVVNGVKSESASSSDIELVRAGASSPEANVSVGVELRTGDTIATKEEDQVVLRVPNKEAGSDDLVFLDPTSKVAIGSICAVAGRVFAWAGFRFRLCTSWGTLGVKGTQFEVNIKPDGELTVLVSEGDVKLYREQKFSTEATANVIPTLGVTSEDISPTNALKVKSDGTTESVAVAPDTRLQNIDYWSDQMIKAAKPAAEVTKGFVNYDVATRVQEFKQARRAALIDGSDSSYVTIAKVFNDWDEGAAAQKSLAKVKDERLRESPDYMVNLAEAQRLQGNITGAAAQLERTLVRYPEYASAYYVRAKVLEDKKAADPVNTPVIAEQIRKNLMAALVLASGAAPVNKGLAENALDKTIKALGRESVAKGPWLSAGYEWFGANSPSEGVKYFGNADISIGNRRAQGVAELAVTGDQFKLKVANQLFTGRIVGTEHAGGISFAMQFDGIGKIGQTRDAVLSVSGSKLFTSFTLLATPQVAGSFSFTTAGRIKLDY